MDLAAGGLAAHLSTPAPQLTHSEQRLSEGVFGLGGNETHRVSFHIILSRSPLATELSKQLSPLASLPPPPISIVAIILAHR